MTDEPNMREATDILAGKLAPARVHTSETLAASTAEQATRQRRQVS